MATAPDRLHAPRPDGRVLRRERSRKAILDAFYALLESGEVSPSPAQVAERTGIAVRTVYRHFAEIDSLFDETTALLYANLRDLLSVEKPTGSLEQRAKALVVAHCELWERIAPFARARNYHAHRSDWLRQERDRTDRRVNGRIYDWLPELERAPASIRDAVEATLSFEHWDRLRGQQRIGPVRTAAAIEVSVLSLLTSLPR